MTPRGSASGRNSPTGVTANGGFSKSSSAASLIRVPSVGPTQQQQAAEQVGAGLRHRACVWGGRAAGCLAGRPRRATRRHHGCQAARPWAQ